MVPENGQGSKVKKVKWVSARILSFVEEGGVWILGLWEYELGHCDGLAVLPRLQFQLRELI